MRTFHRIRNLREDHDLTQKDMGEILDLSQRTYARYEKGDTEIPTDVWIQIADCFEVSTDYLMERTDFPSIHPKRKRPAGMQERIERILELKKKKQKQASGEAID